MTRSFAPFPRSLVLLLTASPLLLPLAAAPTRERSEDVSAHISTYTNPVIDRSFPDPSVLSDRGTFYAYSTNAGGGNMPCARSTDLVHWQALPDALPQLPGWASPHRTWAPNIRAFIPGKRYVAYFCARVRATGQQAIGAAVGAAPNGPFVSEPMTTPLVEQSALGGAIDPSCFVDSDGSRYLVWKNDGNSRRLDTWLWIQRLSADGLGVTGPATRLIKQDQAWEGPLIEAPTLWKHGGRYYLFYSANVFSDCRYAIGYAVSNALTGPYVKPSDAPWVAGGPDTCGPGGEDIVALKNGATWMVYHTWAKGPRSYRAMSLDPLTWAKEAPVLGGPSHTPQLMP